MTIKAFEQLANDVRPRLIKLCERFLAEQQMVEEAEDIVQDALFRLWQMGEQLDSYKSLEALAVTITKNVCVDHLRHQSMRLEPLEGTDIQDFRKADQNLITQDMETIIQLALSQLPATQRRMLEMRAEGMNLDEISTICNTTKQSTKTMISAARRAVLEILRKGGQK